MKFIGVVCFNCKSWLPYDKADSMFNPNERYEVNVILFCPECNPEYYENLVNEVEE